MRMDRCVIALLIAMCLAACGPSNPDTVTVRAEPVALFPDDPGRVRLDQLSYAGGLSLHSDHPDFGGWSALELSADGTRLLALSDSGTWMTADLTWRDGSPAGLINVRLAPLLGPDGNPLTGEAADAEGLAPLGEGRYAVSFEREHRIGVYNLGDDWSNISNAVETPFPAPPGADRLRNNAGIEALGASEGMLYAGVEDPIISGQPHTLWVYDRTLPSQPPIAMQLVLETGFGLTALTVGPDDGLYLIERFWARDVGNRIRIARLSPDQKASAGPTPVQPSLLGELTPDMTVDNIEAAAFADIDGTPTLVLMSDDNFNDAQQTLLLAFQLTP